MDHFIDSHYFQLPSQGNIYTITELPVANHPLKLLVASLKREIFCIEYQESLGGLIPTGKEVSFTYIPSGAEIISIDAFNKSQTKNEFVIGITIIKNSNNLDSFEFYLNIYSEWEETDELNIENVAQNCLNVELNFTPYHLTHTEITVCSNDEDVKDSKEIVFVLSGSDNLVHVYREYSTDHLYKEVETKEYFPEFTKYPSPVVWIDIYIDTNKSERFIATCCECGYVRLTKVCLKTKKLLFNFSTKFINYISCVKIFPKHDQFPQFLDVDLPTEDNIEECFNLLVVNTVLPPVLFENVTKHGLSKYYSLPRQDFNCVLSCCQVADVDFDGEKEIIIGNSEQELMLYKFDREKKSWFLEDLKILSSPLINLRYVDVIGDGVKELVALAMRGVHFLQHDSEQVEDAISGKIALLLSRLT